MTEDKKPRILVVNPGSTSTKVAVLEGDEILEESVLPGPEQTEGGLWEEFPLRLDAVRDWMTAREISLGSVSAVVGRGGLLRPMRGGTYEVTEAMLADAKGNLQGAHASNLGCALARALADIGTREGGEASPIPAFVVDPVSTDEFHEPARYSGLAGLARRSLSHALSIHALVREVCRRRDQPLTGSAFVVAHLGGGISICPVRDGMILDANNANSGGPFSPSRAGGLPTQELLEMAFSGCHTLGELRVLTLKKGGLMSYLGTDDAREVEARIKGGDGEARGVYEAMAYQIAKEIGAMATVLSGKLDAVLLTGGLAASGLLMDLVKDRVSFLGPVEVWPEVEEMTALGKGGLRVLLGEEEARQY